MVCVVVVRAQSVKWTMTSGPLLQTISPLCDGTACQSLSAPGPSLTIRLLSFIDVFRCVYTNLGLYAHIDKCVYAYFYIHTGVYVNTYRCTCACVCLPLHHCRLSAQVIVSSCAALCLGGGSGVFYSCHRRSPRTRESKAADHSISQPSPRRRFFSPSQRRLMSQIATDWVFIATCGCF